jgi:hypothetical protein
MEKKVFLKRIELSSDYFSGTPDDAPICENARHAISGGIETGLSMFGENRKVDIFDIDDQERKDYLGMLLKISLSLPTASPLLREIENLLNKYPSK